MKKQKDNRLLLFIIWIIYSIFLCFCNFCSKELPTFCVFLVNFVEVWVTSAFIYSIYQKKKMNKIKIEMNRELPNFMFILDPPSSNNIPNSRYYIGGDFSRSMGHSYLNQQVETGEERIRRNEYRKKPYIPKPKIFKSFRNNQSELLDYQNRELEQLRIQREMLERQRHDEQLNRLERLELMHHQFLQRLRR